MEKDGIDQTKWEKGGVATMLALYGLFFPFIEILTLTNVIANVVDPLYPEFNTVLGLIAPAIAIFAISVVLVLGGQKQSSRMVGYLSVAILLIFVSLVQVETTMFPASIAGFVVDSNLWPLVTLNIAIYLLAVVLSIVGIAREQPAD